MREKHMIRNMGDSNGVGDVDSLSTLPEDVKEHVLSFLGPSDLGRASILSKGFHTLASGGYLWRRLYVRRYAPWLVVSRPRNHLSQSPEERAAMSINSSETLAMLVQQRDISKPDCIDWKGLYLDRLRNQQQWLYNGVDYSVSRTMKGHKGGVLCHMADPARKLLATGGQDSNIRLWNMETGECTVLSGHNGSVRCLQMDSTRLISGSYDNTMRIWDLNTAQCIGELNGHFGWVTTLQFDRNKIVSGGADNAIKLWDIDDHSCIVSLSGHSDLVSALQYRDDTLLSSSWDGEIKMWSLEMGEAIKTLELDASANAHDSIITCLQWDSTKLVTGSADQTIKITDYEKEKVLHTLQGHSHTVSTLMYDDDKLVTGGFDGVVAIWDLEAINKKDPDSNEEITPVHTLTQHDLAVYCVSFDEEHLISSSWDGATHIRDVSNEIKPE